MNNINGIVRATMLDDNKRNNKSGIFKILNTKNIVYITNTVTDLTGLGTTNFTGTQPTSTSTGYNILITGTSGVLYNGPNIVSNGYYYITTGTVSGGLILPSNWSASATYIIYISSGSPVASTDANVPLTSQYFTDATLQRIYKNTTPNSGKVSQSSDPTDNSLYIYGQNTAKLYNIYNLTTGTLTLANFSTIPANPVLLNDGNIYNTNSSGSYIELGHVFDINNGNYYNNNKIVDTVKIGDSIDIVDLTTTTYYKYLCTGISTGNCTYRKLTYTL